MCNNNSNEMKEQCPILPCYKQVSLLENTLKPTSLLSYVLLLVQSRPSLEYTFCCHVKLSLRKLILCLLSCYEMKTLS